MTIKHYPWLENTLIKYEQRNFASSIIIEGEGGLAKSELATHFAKRLLMTFSTSSPTYPASVSVVASATANGTSKNLAKV